MKKEIYLQDDKSVERIACYIRVSTQEQKLHGLSLDAQRDTLKRYADTHGLKIIEWYEDEGISGRKIIRRRPALQRMLNDAQNGKFDRIIFIKLDRYFRSVAEYHECQKKLEANNVLWTATEEKYDLTTASGRFWVTQKLAMAEYEADNTGERIRLVNEYKVRTGQALAGPQSQGIAYTVKKDSEGVKRVVPDPETKELCMDYINHFLVHQNKKAAMVYVNKKYNTSYQYNTFTNMLNDTKLYGHYRGNDFYCEPYIDKDTYDQIQTILDKNIKHPKSNRVYIFSGLLRCPCCNAKLSGNFTIKKPRLRVDGVTYVNFNELRSYRCNNSRKNNTCSFSKSTGENRIEKFLLTYMDQYITDYIAEAKIEDDKPKNTNVTDQIKKVKSEMTRLNNMYRKERISEAEYDREYDELNSRLKELESHLEPQIERDLTIYEDLLKTGWRTLYEALTPENKRAFWRKYIKEISINEKGQLKPIFF